MKAYEVYPDSIAYGLAAQNKLIAVFAVKAHAEKYGLMMWQKFHIIKEIETEMFHKTTTKTNV